MVEFKTYPTPEQFDQLLTQVQPGQRPNRVPMAMIAKDYLSEAQCQDIVQNMMDLEQYKVSGCGAVTMEAVRPLDTCFNPVVDLVEVVNDAEWKYDLDPYPWAWLQSYGPDGMYQLHTDTYPGQMRKLTAVVMLSDPYQYDDGDLMLRSFPVHIKGPRTRGSIIIFQPWIPHEVTRVTRGYRQTLNVGFYGPNFK